MTRLSASIVLAGLLAGLALTPPAAAADLRRIALPGRFLATCEDLGQFCFADACGRDQIDAAQGCRVRCPSAVILAVAPAACHVPDPQPVVLRRRG